MQYEKAFATEGYYIPHAHRIDALHTTDKRVVLLFIFGDQFKWPNRNATEVTRCPACKEFIFPKDEHRCLTSRKRTGDGHEAKGMVQTVVAKTHCRYIPVSG